MFLIYKNFIRRVRWLRHMGNLSIHGHLSYQTDRQNRISHESLSNKSDIHDRNQRHPHTIQISMLVCCYHIREKMSSSSIQWEIMESKTSRVFPRITSTHSFDLTVIALIISFTYKHGDKHYQLVQFMYSAINLFDRVYLQAQAEHCDNDKTVAVCVARACLCADTQSIRQ